MAYRSSSVALGAADAATLTKATGVVDGDYLLFFCGTTGETVNFGMTPSQSGQATVTGAGSGRPGDLRWAFRVASSEPASYSVTIGGGNSLSFGVGMIAFSGRTGTPTVVSTNNAGDSASPVSCALTGGTAAAGDDVCILQAIVSTNAAGSWAITASPASYTSRATQAVTGTFSGGGVNCTSRDNTSGATGTLTSTWTLAANGGEACGVVVFMNASGGGGSTGRSRMIGGKLVGGILVR
jgi:hypothetical protein